MLYSAVHRPLSKCLLAAAMLASAIFVVAFTSQPTQAQNYNILYTFAGGTKGSGPSDLIVGPNGTLYGIANNSTCACSFIFSLSNGKLTILHRFSEPMGNEADEPQGLLLNKTGTVLYGTTAYGGIDKGNCIQPGFGCGTVFSYDLTTNKYVVLHKFAGTPDGFDPSGTQKLAANGNLFGITWGGGASGWGSFYKVTPAGGEQTLYSFRNSPDGQGPGDGLVALGGNYFGVTIGGGINNCPDGCGTIFKITPAGKETILYRFTGGSDGEYPYQLIGNANGNMYGLSRNSSNVVVAVFEITSSGEFSIAYDGSFVSQIQFISPGPNGTVYGSATGGNMSCDPNKGCGQIFQLIPTGSGTGTVTILHQFDGTDGWYPNGAPTLHNGTLYGGTALGGSTGDGVVYSLKP